MFSKIHYVNKNGIPTPGIPRIFMEKERARDGIRTRGPHLGKVVLHP